MMSSFQRPLGMIQTLPSRESLEMVEVWAKVRTGKYDLCSINSSRALDLTRVALFIDDSGSMTMATVQASNDRFLMWLAENGITDAGENQ